MTCPLLHILEKPDPHPYEDPEVRDVIGALPQFYCAHCTPLKRLKPSEAMKCLTRNEPCWLPLNRICTDRHQSPSSK